MKKADEMILVSSLYNRISQNYTIQSKIESEFLNSCKKLLNEGHISNESYNDALYCFIPTERKKQIENYVEKGKKNNKQTPFSNSTVAQKVSDIIDEVFSDVINPAPTSTTFRSSGDPCSRSYSHSHC